MYLVMADSREKIIGVSDTETGARHAGWDCGNRFKERRRGSIGLVFYAPAIKK